MPALSSSSSEEETFNLLMTTAVATWGTARAAELEPQIRTASRHLRTLFAVALTPRDGEPDYYDNGWPVRSRDT
jgi:hypothetical protein